MFPCSQVKEVIKLIQTQQKKDFAMANKSVKSNRDLPKRLWRVGEVHTNLEISKLSFLLLGKSLDLFEEEKSAKYEENNSRTLCKIRRNIPQTCLCNKVKLAIVFNCESGWVCKETLVSRTVWSKKGGNQTNASYIFVIHLFSVL